MRHLKNLSGIYKITNIVTNDVYVGSAKNLYRRYRYHFYSLSINKHINKILQNSYNKYGKENFIFEVIIFCSLENLIKEEQFYIDTLNSTFNICKTAGNILGVKRSEETKEKIRKNHARHNLGKKFSDDVRKNMCEGQKKRLPPTEETKNKTRNSLLGKTFSDDRKNNLRISHLGHKVTEESLNKRIKKQYKPIIQYDLNMCELNEYGSIKEAIDKTKLTSTMINKMLKGHKSKKFNFTFKYKIVTN